MHRSIAAALAILILVGASEAWAQQRGPISKKLLVGNWSYVRAESVAKDGTRFPLVEGTNPKGLLIFDGITRLVDQSLLHQEEAEDGQPWYVMAETIREFAVERLVESGDAPAIQRRHILHYLRLVES